MSLCKIIISSFKIMVGRSRYDGTQTVRRTQIHSWRSRCTLQRPINTLLICNWSIVIRLLRWSM